MSHSQDPRALTPRRFRLLAFFSHGTNDLYWFILPVVLPLMLAQYNLRYAGGGTVLSVYLLVVAVCSVIAGRLSDRIDRWRMIGFGFLLAGLGFAASAVSPSLPLFVVALVVAAVGVSGFHPAMYGAISDATEARRAGFFGAFESWGTTAITVMFVVVGLLLRTISWKGVLLVVALPGFAAGTVFLLINRSVPNRAPGAFTHQGAAPSAYLLAGYLGSNMLRFFTLNGMLSFIPTYLVFHIGLQPERAAYAGALFFAGGILGARVGGYLGDRFPPYAVMLTALGFVAPFVFLIGLISSPVFLGITLFLLGVAAMTCIPLQNMLLRDFGPQLGAGEVFGIMMGVMTVTQALGPAAFGLVADAAGLVFAVRISAAPALLAWVVLFAISRTAYVRSLAAPGTQAAPSSST